MENKKILYIESNHINIRLMTRTLRTMGYELIVAQDGDEGIQMALDKMPDIILLDINLPQIDGITLIDVFKSYFQTQHIPVVVLTDEDNYHTKLIAQESGADAYLAKPVSRGKLLRVLQMLTAQPVRIA